MDKDLLRKKNMNIRDSLDASEVEMLSHKICERLRQLDEYKKSDVFLMFYPKGNEVRLNELFTENEVYLPKTVRKDMTFHRYTGEEDLVKARFGIMEPSSLSDMAADFMIASWKSIKIRIYLKLRLHLIFRLYLRIFQLKSLILNRI